MKCCPHCRLPLSHPGEAFAATWGGMEYVFIICQPCSARLRRLPALVRAKHIDRAAENAATWPARFPCRIFPDSDTAALFASLGASPVTVRGVVDELMKETA